MGRGGLEKWEDFIIIPKLELKLTYESATVLKCYSLRVESTIMPYSHCFLVCRINIFAHVSYDNNSAMQFYNHYHVSYTRCFVVLCLTLIIRLVLEDLYLDLIYLQTSVYNQL